MCPDDPKSYKTTTLGGNTYASVRGYRPAALKELKSDWYVEFYAYDPARGVMRRKRMKINIIKKKAERRMYGMNLVRIINEKLSQGWNPFIENRYSANLTYLNESFDIYRHYIDKMYASGYYRDGTYRTYVSALGNLEKWLKAQPCPPIYTYQLSRKTVASFLDHIFIERDNSGVTYNKYLSWLKVFTNYMLGKGWITESPIDGLKPISKRLLTKSRTTIPAETLGKIAAYLEEKDKRFLLSCYLLYYCNIRPVEQTRLLISDIRLHDGIISMRAAVTKNRKDEAVTIHPKVAHCMLDLGLFSHPSSHYIFGEDNLRPGSKPTTTRTLRGRWESMAKKLKFKKQWKFYSLKDTGITDMLTSNVSSISVRDQARHSSLSITDLYTSHDKKADKAIIEFKGSL